MIDVNEKEGREEDVWKLPNNEGLIVSSDGKIYAYLKTNTYVNVAEINGVGLNDEAQDTIRKVRDAGHNFWIDPHSISLDFICWYFIEDADGFFMN
jgi:hypothetical protein